MPSASLMTLALLAASCPPGVATPNIAVPPIRSSTTPGFASTTNPQGGLCCDAAGFEPGGLPPAFGHLAVAGESGQGASRQPDARGSSVRSSARTPWPVTALRWRCGVETGWSSCCINPAIAAGTRLRTEGQSCPVTPSAEDGPHPTVTGFVRKRILIGRLRRNGSTSITRATRVHPARSNARKDGVFECHMRGEGPREFFLYHVPPRRRD